MSRALRAIGAALLLVQCTAGSCGDEDLGAERREKIKRLEAFFPPTWKVGDTWVVWMRSGDWAAGDPSTAEFEISMKVAYVPPGDSGLYRVHAVLGGREADLDARPRYVISFRKKPFSFARIARMDERGREDPSYPPFPEEGIYPELPSKVTYDGIILDFPVAIFDTTFLEASHPLKTQSLPREPYTLGSDLLVYHYYTSEAHWRRGEPWPSIVERHPVALEYAYDGASRLIREREDAASAPPSDGLSDIFPPPWKRGDTFRAYASYKDYVAGDSRWDRDHQFSFEVLAVPDEHGGQYQLYESTTRTTFYFRRSPFSIARIVVKWSGSEVSFPPRGIYEPSPLLHFADADGPVDFPAPVRLGLTRFDVAHYRFDDAIRGYAPRPTTVYQHAERRGDTAVFYLYDVTPDNGYMLMSYMVWRKGDPWYCFHERLMYDTSERGNALGQARHRAGGMGRFFEPGE